MPYAADDEEMSCQSFVLFLACFSQFVCLVSSWKHRFSSQCLSLVHDKAFSARTPGYKAIQELDKRVRSFYIPTILQVPGFGGAKIGLEPELPSVELTMQRHIAFAIREISKWLEVSWSPFTQVSTNRRHFLHASGFLCASSGRLSCRSLRQQVCAVFVGRVQQCMLLRWVNIEFVCATPSAYRTHVVFVHTR